MLRVFNCGIGMILVIPRDETEEVLQRLSGHDERATVIGEIERKDPDDSPLFMDPGSQKAS